MIQVTDEPNAVLAELLTQERRVWEALQKGDVEADSALLHPDFLGVYPSGFSDRAGHADQLKPGPSVESYRLSEARVLDLRAGLAMLCYRATYQRVGALTEEAMYVSSLWRKDVDGWRNLFSQDTPVRDVVVP